MTKHTLNTIALSLFCLIAVACGDPGVEPLDVDPGIGGNGGDLGFGGNGGDLGFGGEDGVGGEPVEEEELIAPFDNDSAADPAVDEFLSITGTRDIVYTDQISAEEGDTQDFVQFKLPNNSNPNQRIAMSIDCDVFGDEEVFARIELFNVDNDGATRIGGEPVDCNSGELQVTVRNDQVQLARIFVQGVPQEQTLVEYTIVVAPFN